MHTSLLIAAALVVALAPAGAAQQATTPPAVAAPDLSEAQRLKAPLLAAQMEAAENGRALYEAKLALLKRAAQDLEREYLATVKAPPGSTWDWSRMVPIPPAEKSPPAPKP